MYKIKPALDKLAARSIEIPCLTKGLHPLCWITLKTQNKGYSTVGIRGKDVLGHRVAFEELRGPIPEGLDTDHLCRVRACWNPWHIDPVPRTVNIVRGDGPRVTRERLAALTHCTKGHEYTPENTYRAPGTGQRGCKTCRVQNTRDWRARQTV
jgi:hypothetical protein